MLPFTSGDISPKSRIVPPLPARSPSRPNKPALDVGGVVVGTVRPLMVYPLPSNSAAYPSWPPSIGVQSPLRVRLPLSSYPSHPEAQPIRVPVAAKSPAGNAAA